MLTLNDGRSELWQWDTGRTLAVDADCSQVHFSNKVFGRSLDVDVIDGVAAIPDILLQTDKELTAWAFVGTPENGYTKISKVFKVNKRNKPSDYVFTPTDQTTLDDILNRIEDLEKRPSGDVSKEDIQDAVNEYLDNNPVSVDEKDPTVPDWAKQPNPPEQPDTLPNPHKLTFSGAVSAEYDGSKEVTVEIPEGGSGGNANYELPIANPETLGGVKPVAKGADMTQKVGVDELGGLWTAPGGGGGGKRMIAKVIVEENIGTIIVSTDMDGKPFSLKECYVCATLKGYSTSTNEATTGWKVRLGVNDNKWAWATNVFEVDNGPECCYEFLSNGSGLHWMACFGQKLKCGYYTKASAITSLVFCTNETNVIVYAPGTIITVWGG